MKRLTLLLLSVTITVVFSQGAFAASKPTIVLVHGAFQTAAGWDRVRAKLESKGFAVVAVDLPGRDGDSTSIDQITPDLYKAKILEVVNAQKGPVVLVGHSFGGIQISNVAEAAPDKIKALVYLSAFLPQSGESLVSLSKTDKDSLLGVPGNFVVSADYKYGSIKDEARADIFANDATPSDRRLIVNSLIKEPLGPQGAPVTLTAERFGTVKKYYIETLEDKCVSPYLQTQMIQRVKIQRLFKVNGGHAFYITQPDQVAKDIVQAARDK
jgi:pimeloyl-ACP methyl ester carboxylesterase